MKLIIGTANFLKQYGILKTHIPKSEVIKIFDFLKKDKSYDIDTALKYDNFFKLRNKLNFKKLNFNTKIYFSKNDLESKNYERKYINILKKQIKINKFEKYETIFVHNFEEIKKKKYEKLFNFMNFLKKSNITKKIGISLYNPKNLNNIKKKYNIDIVQVPVNLFDRRFLTSKIKKIFIKKKISLQARSIFLQGALFNEKKITQILKLKKNNEFRDYNNWCLKNKIEKRKVCVNFVKNQKNIHSIVIGIQSLDQLIEIFKDFKSKSKIIYPKKIFSNNLRLIDASKW